MTEQNESAHLENTKGGPCSDRREFLAKLAVAAGGVAAGGLLAAGLNQEAEAAPVAHTNLSPPRLEKAMRKYKLLYVIGDSISLGYCPLLVMSGSVSPALYGVLHAPGNSRDSTHITESLDDWLVGYDPDVVLFNCGLHDVWHETQPEPRTPVEQYEANLHSIVARLGQFVNPPRLIWARTTPVIGERTWASGWQRRYNEEVIAYNEVADAVMAETGVESIDLYGVVMQNDPGVLITPDGTHYTEKGYTLLDKTIAYYLRGWPMS